MDTKRLRRGVLIFGASILGLLLLAVVLFFALGPKPAKPLPNPNGYDDLLKAAQAIYNLDDMAPTGQVEITALVASNAVPLRLLRVGLARPCRAPTDAVIKNYATSGADLVGLKSLAKILAAEGKLALLENRPADAAGSYLDAVSLGNQLSHGGFLINRLVGVACEAIGGVPLAKLVPQLALEQLRPLIPRLEAIIENAAEWADVADNENRFARYYLKNNPSEWLHPIKLASALWQSHNSQKTAKERHDLAAARLRLLLVEIALRCYQADQGKPAENLQALVPKYLKQVPLDPFSNQPLVYHIAKTNWTLYSVGPDRKDDGGQPLGKVAANSTSIGLNNNGGATQTIGDLFFDSPWK